MLHHICCFQSYLSFLSQHVSMRQEAHTSQTVRLHICERCFAITLAAGNGLVLHIPETSHILRRMSGLMPNSSREETGKGDQTGAQENAAPPLGDPKLSAGEHDLLAGLGQPSSLHLREVSGFICCDNAYGLSLHCLPQVNSAPVGKCFCLRPCIVGQAGTLASHL